MARLFDDAASQYLEYGGAVVTDYPFSVAIWFYSDSTAKQTLFWVGDKDAPDNYFEMQLSGETSGTVAATARGNDIEQHANTSSTYSTNTWHHTAAVFTDATDRAAFLDGGNKGTDNVDTTPSGLDRSTIGRSADSTPSDYMSGRIAEVGVWNVALTDAEVAILARGYSPLFVRPQNLVAYWPLIRDEDQDRVGGYDMTAYNTPTIAAHPRVLYPAPPMAIAAPVAAPAIRIPRYGFTNFQVPGIV